MTTPFTAPQRFKRCPSLGQRETAQSYLGRLAAFFGMRGPKDFCMAFELDLRGIMHGHDESLGRLADLTGSSTEELIRWTPKRVDEHFMVLNGEMLNTRDNPRRMFSMCPVCAREDIAAHPGEPWDQAVHGRAEWMLQVVDSCTVHGVKLITHRGPALDAVRLDQGYEATILLEELHALSVKAAEPDDFQLYVLSRIGVLPAQTSPLLDDLPLAVVTQLCHAAGLDVLAGKGKGAALGDVERRKAGFALLGHGEQTLQSKIVEMRRGSTIRLGARRLLHRLMEYLHQGRYEDPALASFIDPFVAILFRNLPYPEGQGILGRRCPKRSLHDFSSAQAAYGIPAHQLEAFLVGTPELAVQPFGRPEDALISVGVADAMFVGKTPFLNTSAVGRKLGRADTLVRLDLAALKQAGLLAEAKGATVSPRNSFYSEPEIDALIQRLVGGQDEVQADDPTMVSLYDLSFRFGMNNQTFWDLVAGGRLTGLRMANGAGFIDGLRADLRQVMQVICGVADAMTRPDVCKLLGVDANIVHILEANDVLRTLPADPRYSNKLGRMFDTTEVEAFRKAYMTLPEVRHSLAGRPSFQRLEKMGLKPAIHLKPLGKAPGYAIFYLRTEVVQLG